MDFMEELVTDLIGELTAEELLLACVTVSCLDLNIFLRRKQLFAHGNLSCIMDIREKNISDETF